MNMKKVLAVVMAVMLAISAMAISAFAAEYEITLSAAGSKANGAAYSTVEFTIPVWAQYGYAVAGDSITLTLPMVFVEVTDDNGTAEDTTDDVVSYVNTTSYVVVANGATYALGNEVTANAAGVVYGDYEIVFGTLAHSYNAQDGNTVIPQSTLVGDNASLTVIGTYAVEQDADGKETYRVSAADFKYYTDPSQNGYTNSKFTTTFWPTTQNYNVKATANDVPTAVSYCWDWNPVDGADILAADSTWDAGLTNLKWDATLVNKAQIIGAETAKVVVKLNKTVVGNYYFGLTATYANGLNYELGNNFNNYLPDVNWGKYAAYVEIEEPTDTITIEIPKNVLYSTNYGVFNETISIECIDLFHQSMIDTINKTNVAAGTIGDYSWTTVNGNKVISFCGQELNSYWNQFVGTANCAGGAVVPASVTLVLGYTDVDTPAEDITVDDPVESTEEETEDITVEEPVEDTNPGTGIALAVVPMVVAAFAVVASKRR